MTIHCCIFYTRNQSGQRRRFAEVEKGALEECNGVEEVGRLHRDTRVWGEGPDPTAAAATHPSPQQPLIDLLQHARQGTQPPARPGAQQLCWRSTLRSSIAISVPPTPTNILKIQMLRGKNTFT